jgi:hypothetical protein
VDTDGTLLTPATLPAGARLPNASYHGWTLPAPGASFHSDVENGMFGDRDCVYLGMVRTCVLSLVSNSVWHQMNCPI